MNFRDRGRIRRFAVLWYLESDLYSRSRAGQQVHWPSDTWKISSARVRCGSHRKLARWLCRLISTMTVATEACNLTFWQEKKPRDLANSRCLVNYANSVDFNFSPIQPIEHGSLSRIISIDFPIRESQFESSTLLFSTIVLHIPRALYEEKQFTVIEKGKTRSVE